MNTEPTPDQTPDEEGDQQLRLINVLYSLEAQIKKQTSLRFAFLRGAVYGLGTVVGATLLLALFGGILAATIDSLADLPLIGTYVNEEASETYLE